MRKYQGQVSNGIRLLDSNFPDWRGRINLETLDMGTCNKCIIGQMFGDYHVGRFCTPELTILNDLTKTAEHGFSLWGREGEYYDLTNEWKFQISGQVPNSDNDYVPGDRIPYFGE